MKVHLLSLIPPTVRRKTMVKSSDNKKRARSNSSPSKNQSVKRYCTPITGKSIKRVIETVENTGKQVKPKKTLASKLKSKIPPTGDTASSKGISPSASILPIGASNNPVLAGASSYFIPQQTKPIEETNMSSESPSLITKIDLISKQLSKLDKLEETNNKVEQTVNHIQNKITLYEESLRFSQGDITELQTQQRKIINQLEVQNNTIEQIAESLYILRAEKNYLEENMRKLEDYSYRDNLLFEGIPERKNENCIQQMQKIMKNNMKIDDAYKIPIVRCHRLGRFSGKARRPRPIIIRFHFYPDRERVFEERRRLKGTNIFVAEHFCNKTTQRRKAMLPLFKACIEAKKKATLIGDRLVVDSKSYMLEDLNQIRIEGVDVQSPAIRSNEKILAFNGRLSMLSNFYPCTVSDNGRIFGSSEGAYQFRKAKTSGNDIKAAQIHAADDPLDQKRLADTLQMSFDDWNAEQAMTKSVFAKFQQNADLAEYLISTGNLTLVHTNAYDAVWGIGLGLRDDGIFDQQQWKGRNILGEILMSLRSKLQRDKQESRMEVCADVHQVHPASDEDQSDTASDKSGKVHDSTQIIAQTETDLIISQSSLPQTTATTGGNNTKLGDSSVTAKLDNVGLGGLSQLETRVSSGNRESPMNSFTFTNFSATPSFITDSSVEQRDNVLKSVFPPRQDKPTSVFVANPLMQPQKFNRRFDKATSLYSSFQQDAADGSPRNGAGRRSSPSINAFGKFSEIEVIEQDVG